MSTDVPHVSDVTHYFFKQLAACGSDPLPVLWGSTMSPGPILERNLLRRGAVRYKLQLPVIFHWIDAIEHTEGGFTSDVALDGALIISSRCPPVGANIRIEILLPSPDHSGEEFRIECIGQVTRVQEQHGASYFGVHGTFDDDHLSRAKLYGSSTSVTI